MLSSKIEFKAADDGMAIQMSSCACATRARSEEGLRTDEQRRHCGQCGVRYLDGHSNCALPPSDTANNRNRGVRIREAGGSIPQALLPFVRIRRMNGTLRF